MDVQYSLEEGDFCKNPKCHSGGKFCLLASLLLAAAGILVLILVIAAYVQVQGGRGEEGAGWKEAELERQTREAPVVDPALQDEPVNQVKVRVVSTDVDLSSQCLYHPSSSMHGLESCMCVFPTFLCLTCNTEYSQLKFV